MPTSPEEYFRDSLYATTRPTFAPGFAAADADDEPEAHDEEMEAAVPAPLDVVRFVRLRPDEAIPELTVPVRDTVAEYLGATRDDELDDLYDEDDEPAQTADAVDEQPVQGDAGEPANDEGPTGGEQPVAATEEEPLRINNCSRAVVLMPDGTVTLMHARDFIARYPIRCAANGEALCDMAWLSPNEQARHLVRVAEGADASDDLRAAARAHLAALDAEAAEIGGMALDTYALNRNTATRVDLQSDAEWRGQADALSEADDGAARLRERLRSGAVAAAEAAPPADPEAGRVAAGGLGGRLGAFFNRLAGPAAQQPLPEAVRVPMPGAETTSWGRLGTSPLTEQIRVVGRHVFGEAFRVDMANVLRARVRGAEGAAMLDWVRQHGVRTESDAPLTFPEMPNYTFDMEVWTVQEVEGPATDFLLVRDPYGSYIYSWPSEERGAQMAPQPDPQPEEDHGPGA